MIVLKKILYVLLAMVLLVCLLEIVFRIIPFHRDADQTVAGLVKPDRELGWRLIPYREGTLATNELGLRDTPYNAGADIKILLLGDSLSWGHGLGDVKKGYPFLLEKALSEQSGRAVEVINASVPGYSTFQELRYLQLYGMALDPDLIILQFCLNDVTERYKTIAAYGGDDIFLGVDTRQFIQGVNGWLLRKSKFYEAVTRLLIGLWRDRKEYDVKKLASDKLSRELKSAWGVTLSEIDGIRRISLENNVPLMIVVAPYNFQLYQPQKTDQPQSVLKQYGRDHHIPVIDLLPGFVSWKMKNNRIPLFLDSNHFSSWGHKLTAGILVEPVLKVINRQEKTTRDRRLVP